MIYSVRAALVTGLALLTAGTALAGGAEEQPGASAGAAGEAMAASGLEVMIPGRTVVWGSQAAFEADTGATLPAFSEAPVLAAMVAAGDLPPVEERLPDQVVVVDPLDEMGVYGGEYRAASTTPGCCGDFEVMFTRFQNLLTVNPEIDATLPNVVLDWDLTEDYKSLTLTLRDNMKWSDGAPFTADDFLFWWDDFTTNDQLSQAVNVAWKPGGTPMTVTKVNDTTVRMQFAAPYPIVVDKIAFSPYARNRATFPVTPKHYLSQFHADYNDQADANAKAAGFEDWTQHFLSILAGESDNRNDVDFPTIEGWDLAREDEFGSRFFHRNPYYWKVDTAGRQLPYVDSMARVLVESREVAELKTIAGEFHTGRSHLQLKNWTLYKENEAQGGYRALLWNSPVGNEMRVAFNQLYEEDPVLRDLFQDLRFRQAMSLAINRDEINDLVFFGRAVPSQIAPPPLATYHEPWMNSHFAEYDVDRANALLDEVGLAWDENRQWRLRPDGAPLSLLFEYYDRGDRKPIFELIEEYWEAVGVEITLKLEEDRLWSTRNAAGQVQVSHHPAHLTTDVGFALREAGQFRPGDVTNHGWDDWWTSGATAGVTPPQEVQEIYALLDRYLQTPLFTPESTAIGKEYSTRMVRQLYGIGTVSQAPVPVIVRNDLINVPDVDWWWPEGRWFNNTIPEQWFIRQ